MASTQRDIPRYFIHGTKVHVEEDATHEFKGHINLSAEEIPHWAYQVNSEKRTRQPISRAINGFLNSGRGGHIYCGIIDSGEVKGINRTQYQKDHFMVSIEDLLSRYNPPVEHHRVSVTFVPVVDQGSTPEEIERVVNYDSMQDVDPKVRRQDHIMREGSYRCWCNNEAKMRLAHTSEPPLYIIVISIHPWDPTDARNKYAVGKMKAPPIHEEETESAFFRRQATVVKYNTSEIQTNAENIVNRHYKSEIERLKMEKRHLQEMIDTKSYHKTK